MKKVWIILALAVAGSGGVSLADALSLDGAWKFDMVYCTDDSNFGEFKSMTKVISGDEMFTWTKFNSGCVTGQFEKLQYQGGWVRGRLTGFQCSEECSRSECQDARAEGPMDSWWYKHSGNPDVLEMRGDTLACGGGFGHAYFSKVGTRSR